MNEALVMRITEISFYVISLTAIFLLLREKDYETAFHFGTGFIFGIALELISVNLLGGYHYNPDWLINLGNAAELKHFPLVGGFTWGGLMSLAYRRARQLWGEGGTLATRALTAFLIVSSWDFMYDVVAVRLNGGLWVWEGRTVDEAVNWVTLFGVNWTNFVGYAVVFFIYVGVIEFTNQKFDAQRDNRQRFKFMLVNALACCLLFVASMAAINFLAELVPPFAATATVVLYALAMVLALRQVWKHKSTIGKQPDLPFLVMMVGSYILSIVCALAEGVPGFAMWFFLLHLVFGVVCVLLGITKA